MASPTPHALPPYPEIPDVLETERLLIRPPRLADVPEIFAAVTESLELLMPWMPWATPAYTLEACEMNTRQAIADFLVRRDLRYHFHHRQSGRLLACSGLHRIDWQVPKFEIGYWCRQSETGKGYVTEGVRALAELALGDLGGVRVEIRCDDRNVRSAAVAERCGFELEGVLHNDRRVKGEVRSSRIYARTRP